MVDMVCPVPQVPLSGQGAVLWERSTHVGGCAFNTANIVRQLGGSCFPFVPVGRGVYASFIAEELERRGFEVLQVEGERDCGACICLVEPDGERTMITMPGIERFFEPAWFHLVDAGRFGMAVANGYELEGDAGWAIIEFLEQHPAIQFVYAPGPRIKEVDARKTARINALKPIWHLNDLEALSYTGAVSLEVAGFELAAQCGNAVIVTEGARGSHVFAEGGQVLVEAPSAHVVDTIGAGDAHVGVVMAARNAGYGWHEALSLANRIASALCEIPGATFSDEQFAKLGVRL